MVLRFGTGDMVLALVLGVTAGLVFGEAWAKWRARVPMFLLAIATIVGVAVYILLHNPIVD